MTQLIQEGAEVNAVGEDGMTALMLAAKNNSNPEVTTALVRNGADINARAQDGRRALDFAESNRNLVNTDALRELTNRSR